MLVELRLRNYKSLRDIVVRPGPLTVLVGANAAGKTNFADGLDFVSEIFRHGLAVAIARKGGYDNIAHRKIRRSKGALRVGLTVEFDARESWLSRRHRKKDQDPLTMQVDYNFSFRAHGQSIRAEFKVESENLAVRANRLSILDAWREGDSIRAKTYDPRQTPEDFPSEINRLLQWADLDILKSNRMKFPPTQLFLDTVWRFVPALDGLMRSMSGIRVYQFSPTNTREFGIPIPNPELQRHGGNLPAVVDLLRKDHRKAWDEIISVMRKIIPGLHKIEVGYTHSRTLGLFFHEHGVGRPWTVAEVSDGTVQSLALLVGLHDPRTTALVLEEPENSIHPWILRHIIQSCRLAARAKQVLITTHSPIVINSVVPGDIWVIWRERGESRIERLESLDETIIPLWEDGTVNSFEFMDSGAVVEALPPQLSLQFDDDEERE